MSKKNNDKIIYCKGRYSIHGKSECIDSFEYIGDWGDEELVKHADKEKSLDTKKTWWTGFEINKKFENLKRKVEDIRED
jgi:hypothetical protein